MPQLEDIAGIDQLGVTEIVDPSDLRNGRPPKLAADPTFYDIIEWLKELVPQAARHSFFTPVAQDYVGETVVVFSGTTAAGSSLNHAVDAAQLRREDTDQSGRVLFEGSATALCALQLAFTGTLGARQLYPGYDARHPSVTNPVGKVRPEWGSGPMYEFAAGVNPADYPETDPSTNHPLYRFFIDGEWLVFERTKKYVRGSGPFGSGAKVVPAWRLQGR